MPFTTATATRHATLLPPQCRASPPSLMEELLLSRERATASQLATLEDAASLALAEGPHHDEPTSTSLPPSMVVGTAAIDNHRPSPLPITTTDLWEEASVRGDPRIHHPNNNNSGAAGGVLVAASRNPFVVSHGVVSFIRSLRHAFLSPSGAGDGEGAESLGGRPHISHHDGDSSCFFCSSRAHHFSQCPSLVDDVEHGGMGLFVLFPLASQLTHLSMATLLSQSISLHGSITAPLRTLIAGMLHSRPRDLVLQCGPVFLQDNDDCGHGLRPGSLIAVHHVGAFPCYVASQPPPFFNGDRRHHPAGYPHHLGQLIFPALRNEPPMNEAEDFYLLWSVHCAIQSIGASTAALDVLRTSVSSQLRGSSKQQQQQRSHHIDTSKLCSFLSQYEYQLTEHTSTVHAAACIVSPLPDSLTGVLHTVPSDLTSLFGFLQKKRGTST